jgi:putative intracellular protease/amidase
MNKNVYLFACPGLADWEPAFAISMISDLYGEIPKKRSYHITTFGLDKQPVKTLGGVTILPDTDIKGVVPADAAMIILPGSKAYLNTDFPDLAALINNCRREQIPVAAICGGTAFLAKHGFLDSVKHTSCGKQWLLSMAPGYTGTHLYLDEPSVSDNGIITANPLGFVEFAGNIMRILDVSEPEFIDFLLKSVKEGYLNVDLFADTHA